jgi:hypothetical protein
VVDISVSPAVSVDGITVIDISVSAQKMFATCYLCILVYVRIMCMLIKITGYSLCGRFSSYMQTM